MASTLQSKRDECVALFGPEAEQCQRLIEAHKVCLRSEGFKVCLIARQVILENFTKDDVMTCSPASLRGSLQSINSQQLCYSRHSCVSIPSNLKLYVVSCRFRLPIGKLVS